MLNRLREKRRDGSPPDDTAYLIVGLGNPGRRYARTRHNAGFMVIDRLAETLPIGTERSRFQAAFAETRDGDRRVVLVKPQTFMNESGIAVGQLARWYKTPHDRLLVVYDDLDLPFGTIRMRAGGSAGGHNGIASVIQHLNTQEFARLRIGISRPRTGSTVPYVLSHFTADEQCELPAIIERAAEAALMWLREGTVLTMNAFNRRPNVAHEPETVQLPSPANTLPDDGRRTPS